MKKNLVFTLGLVTIALVALMTVNASAPSGPYVFKDDFTNPADFVNNWTPPSPVPSIAGSIVTLAANKTISTVRTFHHGVLTMNISFTAASNVTFGLAQSGMFDGGLGLYFNYTHTPTADTLRPIIGSMSNSSQQITSGTPFDTTTLTVSNFNVYTIQWNYTGATNQQLVRFTAGSQAFDLVPFGNVAWIDMFALPIQLSINSKTIGPTLKADYVVVADSLQTVQIITTTIPVTQTTTIPATVTVTGTASTTQTITSTSTIPTSVTSTSTLYSYSTTTNGTSTRYTTTTTNTVTVGSTTTTIPTTTIVTTISGTATSIITNVTTVYSTNFLQTTAFSTTTISATAQEWGYIYAIIAFIGVGIICLFVVIHRLLGRGRKPPPERYTGGTSGETAQPIVEIP